MTEVRGIFKNVRVDVCVVSGERSDIDALHLRRLQSRSWYRFALEPGSLGSPATTPTKGSFHFVASGLPVSSKLLSDESISGQPPAWIDPE